tara:strand:+ start:285 stop:560 length:276 start_codon:yes stop_codon:yes gene_type:complete
MFSYKLRIISLVSVFLFIHFTLHSFEHYADHISGAHDEAECAYFDLTKFAPTDYQDNSLIFPKSEIKNSFPKNSKFFNLARLYDPRGPPQV